MLSLDISEGRSNPVPAPLDDPTGRASGLRTSLHYTAALSFARRPPRASAPSSAPVPPRRRRPRRQQQCHERTNAQSGEQKSHGRARVVTDFTIANSHPILTFLGLKKVGVGVPRWG